MTNDQFPPVPTSSRESVSPRSTTSSPFPPSIGGTGTGQAEGSRTGGITMDLWEAMNPDRVRPAISFVSSADYCPRCFSAIWHLWSRSGFDTKLDPEPLDFKADLACYIAKRRTYKLWRIGPYRFEIDSRLDQDIERWDGSGVVLAEHVCDRNNIRDFLPDYWHKPATTVPTTSSEEAPF